MKGDYTTEILVILITVVALFIVTGVSIELGRPDSGSLFCKEKFGPNAIYKIRTYSDDLCLVDGIGIPIECGRSQCAIVRYQGGD